MDNLKSLIRSRYDFQDFVWKSVKEDDEMNESREAEEQHDDGGVYKDSTQDRNDGFDVTEKNEAATVVG